jgi:hypothetical protein
VRRLAGRVIAAILFSFLASSSFGQLVGAAKSSSERMLTKAPGCSTNGQPTVPDRNQPYTAEIKTTTVQLQANGVTITRESTETRAVDSQRRTFQSRIEPQSSPDLPAFTWATADDPVENTQTEWNSQTKTARVIKLPLESQRHGCWSTDSGNMRMDYGPATPAEAAAQRERMKSLISAAPRRISQPKTEDLGTTTIQGVEAQGDRITNIIAAGQMGNDKELVTITENWFAPSLGLEMRQVHDDPRNGKTTMEVTHLDLSEPPLALFQPPEGYEVTVEELHQVPCEEQRTFGGAAAAVHGIVH